MKMSLAFHPATPSPPAAPAPKHCRAPAPSAPRLLFDRWFNAWVERSEARWRTVELRQRYY